MKTSAVSVRAEDVKLADKADIEKLRSRVKKMQDEDKATFTDAELKNLTAAEKALADLEQRSKNAHKAVAALTRRRYCQTDRKGRHRGFEQGNRGSGN